MESRFRLMALLSACVLIGACSTTPASHETANPVPQANRVYLEDKTLTNEEVRKLFEQGYKPTSRNGEIYYCRREAALGTRFETTTCRTAAQMKQMEQESKDLATQQQRPSEQPTGH